MVKCCVPFVLGSWVIWVLSSVSTGMPHEVRFPTQSVTFFFFLFQLFAYHIISYVPYSMCYFKVFRSPILDNQNNPNKEKPMNEIWLGLSKIWTRTVYVVVCFAPMLNIVFYYTIREQSSRDHEKDSTHVLSTFHSSLGRSHRKWAALQVRAHLWSIFLYILYIFFYYFIFLHYHISAYPSKETY